MYEYYFEVWCETLHYVCLYMKDHTSLRLPFSQLKPLLTAASLHMENILTRAHLSEIIIRDYEKKSPILYFHLISEMPCYEVLNETYDNHILQKKAHTWWIRLMIVYRFKSNSGQSPRSSIGWRTWWPWPQGFTCVLNNRCNHCQLEQVASDLRASVLRNKPLATNWLTPHGLLT